jgi:hypothetical protein
MSRFKIIKLIFLSFSEMRAFKFAVPWQFYFALENGSFGASERRWKILEMMCRIACSEPFSLIV